MNCILETSNLTKKHRDTYRVREVSLHIPAGCVYGFLGPNGAGKTTTMKMILGLVKPDEGGISLFGQPVTEKNRLSLLRRTGSLIETPGGYGHLTGLENMQIVRKLKGVPESEIVRVLQTVRLYEQKDKKLRQYSLGMRQRLGIAMALLGSPKLLLLDEPTNGLDPAGIREIRELIRALPREQDTTVLVSSHLLSEVEQMADQVGIIHHGSLLYEGPLSELDAGGSGLEEVFLSMTQGGDSL